LAGEFPAAYVTKPLVRWSRHRDLLKAAARLRPFSARWHLETENFLNVAVIGGAAGVALGIAGVFWIGWAGSLSGTHLPGIVWIILGVAALPMLLVLLGALGWLFPREIWAGWRSKPKRSAVPRSGLWRLEDKAGERRKWEELYLAGVGFRGAAALMMSERAFLTRWQVWRLRWGWPVYFALWPVFLNVYAVLQIEWLWRADIQAALGGFVCWFFVFNALGLALRTGMPFWSVTWAFFVFDPKAGRERLGLIMSRAWATFAQVLGLWAGCFIFLYHMAHPSRSLTLLLISLTIVYGWAVKNTIYDPDDRLPPPATEEEFRERIRRSAARKAALHKNWERARQYASYLFLAYLSSMLFLPQMAQRGGIHFFAASLALALLVMGRRAEAILIAGDHQFLRQTLRDGERAFREYVQREDAPQ
jgi:hypothetical protein